MKTTAFVLQTDEMKALIWAADGVMKMIDAYLQVHYLKPPLLLAKRLKQPCTKTTT